MIFTAKLLAIAFGLAMTAFTVSTIVIAVQKSGVEDDLLEAQQTMISLEETLKSLTATTTSTSSTTTTEEPPTEIGYRLPGKILPIHYNINLEPDLKSGLYNSQVIITMQIVEATDRIVLHSKNLEITRAQLLNAGATNVVVGFSLDPVREFLIIDLAEKIETDADNVRLVISFKGEMEGRMVGFYSNSYTKSDGSIKTIATTQFEPIYARQAFPCFDEPAIRATFSSSMVYFGEGDYHALSNMDGREETENSPFTQTYFETSVPMSTHVWSFVLSDFKEKSATIDTGSIGDGFTLRAFASPDQLNKIDFALMCGTKIMEYYIQYFQVYYPLSKLDMVPIPDSGSDTMGHWGLITYREASFLYDSETSSTVNKQNVVRAIAHQLVHLWYGNLVALTWWDDLWLNEGLASYIENKGVHSIFPEWNMDDQFIIDTVHDVLSLDGTLGSRPINQTVENSDQIAALFDPIFSSKGASIMRMLEDMLTTDVFEEIVRNYLIEHTFSNAAASDFFVELDKLGLWFDATEIMQTWTEQMGLPVVSVEKISDWEYKLTQKRFFSNPDDYNGVYDDSPAFNYRWSIPVTYYTSESSTREMRWFYHNEPEIIIGVPEPVKWIKFNRNQVGYYRVNYEEDMWKALIAQLIEDHNVFSIADRASLLNDVFSLADSTQLSFDIVLDMLTYLAKETDYVPWSVASSKLLSLKNSLMHTDIFQEYSAFAQKLINQAYEVAGWEVGDDHLKNRLRITAIDSACSLGHEGCNAEVVTRFATWLENPNERPHPDLREAIYYYGMWNSGSESTWNKMWELFITEKDAAERSKLMYGLSAVQVPWILSRYVQLAWNERYIRGQDYFTCLRHIAANPVGQGIVWEYLRENWLNLIDRFGLNERNLGSMISSITSRFNTQTKLEEIQQFFEKYPEAGAGANARVQALEIVKNNIKWLEENKTKLAKRIQKRLSW